ncbi:hypothetical protein L249_7944 [Ophiocordyceps polyrhachis-furcata BCC 54312]|uniref:Uncharacterized protein n=1 Tax=Ophiocordyceps polyrhachis-furcata BCC 54312 TaxID=1330021 RepID=A0A367LHN6_9HYPO|nr:hypothetical protein L249_7944 [Ophiocordyceps polyrhachis-furcata BCC 54312]
MKRRVNVSERFASRNASGFRQYVGFTSAELLTDYKSYHTPTTTTTTTSSSWTLDVFCSSTLALSLSLDSCMDAESTANLLRLARFLIACCGPFQSIQLAAAPHDYQHVVRQNTLQIEIARDGAVGKTSRYQLAAVEDAISRALKYQSGRLA